MIKNIAEKLNETAQSVESEIERRHIHFIIRHKERYFKLK